MIYSTEAIVLRAVKYGESSLIVKILTEKFGLQSYILNGVRGRSKTSAAHLYQPASILEMQVYHNDLKNLQRIKESKWKLVYQSIFTDVLKNTIALFMVELLQKSILHEEQNEDLYDFAENQLIHLDTVSSHEAANIPVQFMLMLPAYLGFQIQDNFSDKKPFFDPKEGRFTGNDQEPQIELSSMINTSLSEMLRNIQKNQQGSLPVNSQIRRSLLYLLEKYYQWHIDGFSELKTLRVVETILRG